jgi:hypothetical protein
MLIAESRNGQAISRVAQPCRCHIAHWSPLVDMMLTGFSTYLHDTIVAVDSDIHQIRRF